LYIDNAPTHDSKITENLSGHNPLKRLPHPPHSIDISPLDFDIVGKVKSALIGPEISGETALIEAVTEILNGISGAEL
jgi:hypothetical protein